MARQEIPITVLGPSGGPLAGVNVTVNRRGSSAATIFAAETGTTTAPNPLTTAADGSVSAWADRGRYDLLVNDPSGRIGSYTVPWDSSPPELYGALQTGVVAAGDLAVSGSATMVLPVAAGAALITNVSGLLLQYGYTGGTVTVGANASGNPRLDQIVFDGYTVSVLAGTATAGATLDNRTGAAALPAGSIRLADVLVASGATALASSVIRDRRPWARGALWTGVRTADVTMTGTTAAAVDAVQATARVECAGVPVRLSFSAEGDLSAGGVPASPSVQFYQDGVAIPEGQVYFTETALNVSKRYVVVSVITPTAGSHVFDVRFSASAGVTFNLRGAQRIVTTVEELVRQTTANNATTG